MIRLCRGATKAGHPCRNAGTYQGFCFHHDPSPDGQARRAMRAAATALADCGEAIQGRGGPEWLAMLREDPAWRRLELSAATYQRDRLLQTLFGMPQ